VSNVLELLNESLTGVDWDADFGKLLSFAKESQKWLAEFESTEKERTGIKNLKVGYNDTFGYYIEVPKSRSKDVPPYYMKRQTLDLNLEYKTLTAVLRKNC